MSSELKVDTISEKTSAGGVTIDGVKLKDNAVLINQMEMVDGVDVLCYYRRFIKTYALL